MERKQRMSKNKTRGLKVKYHGLYIWIRVVKSPFSIINDKRAPYTFITRTHCAFSPRSRALSGLGFINHTLCCAQINFPAPNAMLHRFALQRSVYTHLTNYIAGKCSFVTIVVVVDVVRLRCCCCCWCYYFHFNFPVAFERDFQT